jgi:hypothetical protein
MPSLFARMWRYPPGSRFNPTENQHTEALASVLDADPGLCREHAADWLGIPPERVGSGGKLRTQIPASGLERVDLELRFGPVGP